MDRRRFLLTSLAAALAAPLAAAAQQAGKVWKIGLLSYTRFPGEEALRIEAFRQGLRDLGYVEGRDLTIEYRYSDGKDELLPALATELVWGVSINWAFMRPMLRNAATRNVVPLFLTNLRTLTYSLRYSGLRR